jgi:hypothetical protein
MLFRRFSGFMRLINASTYGYDHDEVVQESKPNEWNSVVDTNCNQVTPAIIKPLDENSTYSLLKKGIYLFPSLRL